MKISLEVELKCPNCNTDLKILHVNDRPSIYICPVCWETFGLDDLVRIKYGLVYVEKGVKSGF